MQLFGLIFEFRTIFFNPLTKHLNSIIVHFFRQVFFLSKPRIPQQTRKSTNQRTIELVSLIYSSVCLSVLCIEFIAL